MTRRVASKLILLIAAIACCVSLVGCGSGQMPSSTEEQKANSEYMLQVNEIMNELNSSMALFNEAVSRGDVVNMRTQADNAYKSLDKLQKTEAPQALSEIKKNYVDGTSKLREALDGYIALYTELANSDGDVDKSAYDEEIARIQKLYDEGFAALQKGDELANPSSGSASSEAASTASSSAEASASSAEQSSSTSVTPPSGPNA